MHEDGTQTPSTAGGRHDPVAHGRRADALAAMRRANPALWAPVYGEFSRSRFDDRLAEVVATLVRAGEAPDDVEARLASGIQHHVYDAYEASDLDEEPASFAFVVPSRLTRSSADFAHEGDDLFPIAGLLDPVTKQLLWSSLCPMVLDRYHAADGRSGVMLACPLTADIMADLPLEDAFRTARRMVIDTVAFAARRFGAPVVGLGAILPKLTDFGRAAALPGVAVTSGHGGTCWLVLETVRGLGADLDDVGVLGAGAIGTAVLHGLLDTPGVGTVHVHDHDRRRAAELEARYADLGRVRVVPSVGELLSRASVTVSATTSPVDLDDHDVDIEGRWIVDDSQPACFDADQVEARGGRVCWVVGQDGSLGSTATRRGHWGRPFDYGGLGTAAPHHLWGCEAEAHAIASVGKAGDRVDEPVRPHHVERIGELCRAAGTTVAPPQRWGRLI